MIVGFPVKGGRASINKFTEKLNQRNLIEFAYSLIENKVNLVNTTDIFWQLATGINS